jgi:hypothetical protein
MLERIKNTLEIIEVNDYQVTGKIISKCEIEDSLAGKSDQPGNNVTITMQIPDAIKSKMILNIFRNINKENSSCPEKMLTVCSWEMENYFVD